MGIAVIFLMSDSKIDIIDLIVCHEYTDQYHAINHFVVTL